VFEQDEPKYYQYEEAIFEYLKGKPKDKETVIFLVGAGRGPIAFRCLVAADRADVPIKLFAIEKNPYSFRSLEATVNDFNKKWRERVTLVHTDVKKWKPDQKCDLMVSELLGSFGDNELSPECLSWSEWLLKPEGVCIPQDYTSFAAPVSSSFLFNKLSKMVQPNPYEHIRFHQIPYVVKFGRHYLPC
jgi:protein arginine N-methyltransferase 5